MDPDNPWGTSTSDSSPNLAATRDPRDDDDDADAPRLSLETEPEDASWGADAPEAQSAEQSSGRDQGEPSRADSPDPSHEVERDRDEEPQAAEPAESVHEGGGEEKPSDAPSPDAIPVLPPPIPLITDTDTATEEPPMDDFPDDDAFSSTSATVSQVDEQPDTFTVPAPALSTEPSEAPPMDDFDDFGGDDDEFGEMGDAEGGDDDFGDFGDFGGSAPLDESAFDAPAPPPPIPSTVEPPSVAHPVASTSFLPPLRMDLSNQSTRRSVAPQIKDFVSTAWGNVSDKVNDEPERQVEGVAQVLVTEESRSLLASLSSLPPLKPLDWKRSKIRREHLVSMGIPVNLDDSTDSKPVSSLGIAPSPRLSGSLTRPSSAPPGASPLPFSSSRVPSRSSTPFADRDRARRPTSPPRLDETLANDLVSLKEDDLTLMSLDKLRGIANELEKISVDASEVLTHALLRREKESQDKETYNGMISDLVMAAAKMKTTSSTSGAGKGRDPKRQGSIRWGRGGG